jgi:DNA-binding CsgD family transcriptional regulator
MSVDEVRQFYGAGPNVDVMSSVFRRVAPTPAVVEVVNSVPLNDAVGVRGHNPSGTGFLITAPSIERYALTPRTRAALGRVAVHLAAALRIRRVTEGPAVDAGADAVFSQRGKLEHLATPDVSSGHRKALGSAVEHRLLGQRIRRTEPERALELWRALVAGRWSLVNHADRDGKRFILARRNDPLLERPTALDATERLVALFTSWGHSNKLVAYELGLSSAATSETLKRALRKLRLRSRAELVRIFGAAE